jgi:hypothetical protein
MRGTYHPSRAEARFLNRKTHLVSLHALIHDNADTKRASRPRKNLFLHTFWVSTACPTSIWQLMCILFLQEPGFVRPTPWWAAGLSGARYHFDIYTMTVRVFRVRNAITCCSPVYSRYPVPIPLPACSSLCHQRQPPLVDTHSERVLSRVVA